MLSPSGIFMDEQMEAGNRRTNGSAEMMCVVNQSHPNSRSAMMHKLCTRGPSSASQYGKAGTTHHNRHFSSSHFMTLLTKMLVMTTMCFALPRRYN